MSTKKIVARAAVLSFGAASMAARADAIDVSSVTSALTSAGTSAGVVGLAVLVVIVGIKAFKYIRQAL